MGKYLDRISFKNDKAPWLNDINLNKLQDNVEEAIINMSKLIFPIGSTYVTQTDANPNEILGFGTWERLKGKVCLGLDEDDTNFNTIGKTGGESKHILTINEMPSHKHGATSWRNPSESTPQPTNGFGMTGNMAFSNVATEGDGTSRTDWDFNGIESAGGNQAHNNLQPYEVVGYMWIRRA